MKNTTGFQKQNIVSTRPDEEQLPYFKEWQHIISGYVINLNTYLLWRDVALKFNIYRKCNVQVRKALQKWYSAVLKNENIANLSIYQLNQNVSLPPTSIAKQTSLDVEQEKKHILNYTIKYSKNNRKKTLPLMWTLVSDNLGFTEKYTRETRQVLKKWYQKEIFPQWQYEFYGKDTYDKIQLIKAELNSTKTPKSINLVIESKPKNLELLTTDAFLHIQGTMKNINEPLIKNYLNNFFKAFSTSTVQESICIQYGKIGKNHINCFHSVHDLDTFKKYWQSIPGLYPKLILWSIDNPFDASRGVIKHHAMPEFLLNDDDFNFKESQIRISYNIVKTIWIIHLLMHLVRFVEYIQPQEVSAIRTFTQFKGLKEKLSLYETNPLKLLASVFQDLFKSKVLETYPDFEAQIIKNRNKGLEKIHQNKMADTTKQVLSVNSVWRCCARCNKEEKPFDFTHFAQKLNHYSLQAFTKVFIEHYNQRNTVFGDSHRFTQDDVSKVASRVGNYLAGRNRETSIYGFYLVDAKSPVLPYRSKRHKEAV